MRHLADFPFAERKTMEGALEVAMVLIVVPGGSGASYEMQTAACHSQITSSGAHLAVAIVQEQPDPSERDARALCNASGDCTQNLRQGALACGGDHDLRQLGRIHKPNSTTNRRQRQRLFVILRQFVQRCGPIPMDQAIYF